MTDRSQTLHAMLQQQPVIPVITLERLADAVPLAEALVAGGLPMIEITLRSEVAIDAIRLIEADVPGAIAGAGTVLQPKQFEQAERAGARFIVSPGTTIELLGFAQDSAVPFLPGAITPGECMSLYEEGYSLLKFFPAEPAGGARYLAAMQAPLPQIRFCPTGGITQANAAAYLRLANVVSVGGSWPAPGEWIRNGNWQGITQLAREAAASDRSDPLTPPVVWTGRSSS